MMNDLEIALIKRASKGDIESFEKLIIQYEKVIYNAAYRIMLNPEDAKDISQEIIIKIYRNIDKCKDPKAFKSWMFKIIKNTCMDEFRKRKGKYTESLDMEHEWEEGDIKKQIPSEGKTPEEELLTNETVCEVRRAIELLPENYRLLIVLRDLNGLSYEEIAEITDANLGTVKSRISRARSALKSIIDNSGNKNNLIASDKYNGKKGGKYNG